MQIILFYNLLYAAVVECSTYTMHNIFGNIFVLFSSRARSSQLVIVTIVSVQNDAGTLLLAVGGTTQRGLQWTYGSLPCSYIFLSVNIFLPQYYSTILKKFKIILYIGLNIDINCVIYHF